MKQKCVWVLMLAAIAASFGGIHASAAAMEAAESQSPELPIMTIEGQFVEADSGGRAVVVRYAHRGVRSARWFRVTKSTVFMSQESSRLRLTELKAGDTVLVQYQIIDGRAVAMRIEKNR